MPTERQIQRFAEVMGLLKRDNPEIADQFRMSKSGESIAHFEPGKATGVVLYATYIGHEGIVYCVVDGKGMSAPPQEYEGFPDPPKPTPSMKVGDTVTRVGGRMSGGRTLNGKWVTNWDEPDHPGMLVTRVWMEQGSDRNWTVRVEATDPAGYPGNYVSGAERFFRVEAPVAC